ncbi:MAG TPA: rhomboid family intramembrane serine protease [Polyangiaceae bacterium]
MFPIKDENPTRTFPFVNYLLIAANVLGYVYETLLIQRSGEAAIVTGYGLVATRLLLDPLGEAFTIFTSMFMHGGLMHLGGNLLYLYIFGDNVEDSLGHGRYVGFYLLSGIAAAAAQILTGVDSPIAMVGASGAISGVLGAYIVLFPRAPILVINSIPLLWLFWGFFLSFPAWLVIGFWFLGNLLSGVSSLGMSDVGGVAFFAHIGGFIAGLLLVRPLLSGRSRRDSYQWAGWRPPPKRPLSRSRYEAWRDK